MKRLYRSQTDRKVAGIFGGLGELYNIDPNLLRLLAVLIFFISGFFPLLITYLIAWILLPDGELPEPFVKEKPPEEKKVVKAKPSRTTTSSKKAAVRKTVKKS